MLSKISAPHQPKSICQSRLFAYSLLILNVGLLLPISSQAVTFNKLVDTLDQIPGEAGKKFTLGHAALSGNILVFSDNNNQALWSMDIRRGTSSLVKLADTHTPIPQGTGNFKSVRVQNSGGKVIFKGLGDERQSGVYSISATGGEINPLFNQNTLYKNVPAIFPIYGSCQNLLSQSPTMLAASVLAAIGSTDVAASPNQQCLTTPYYNFNINMNNNLSYAVLLPQFTEGREPTRIVFSLDSATGNFSPLFKASDSTCSTPVSLWGDFDIDDDIAAFGFFVGEERSLSLVQQPTELASSSLPKNNRNSKQLIGKHCTSILSSVTGLTTICSATESVVVAGSFKEMNNFNPSCLKPLAEHSSIVIASGRDIVPGTEPNPRTFDSENAFFGSPVADGNTVVFAGTAKPVSGSNISGEKPEHFGLYSATVNQDKKIRKLIDTKTPVPNGTGNFSAFGYYRGNNDEDLNSAYYSLSGNQVAFMGEDAVGKKGLYLSSITGDFSTKIIAVGDNLSDGRIVGEVVINKDSLHGDQLLFTASFGNKDMGIYLGNLAAKANPDPKTCLMNWAEATYPSLFSPAASTQTLAPYTYRYYKNSNAYLGISSADNHVYYLGADGVLKDAGDLVGWLAKANCQ